MKMTRTSLVGAIGLSLSLLAQHSYASNVEYASNGKYLLASTYAATASTTATRLPTGYTVELGTFTAGFSFALNTTNYAATNAAFTLLDTTTIGTGAGTGQFDKISQQLDSFAASGQQLYIWAFNSATPSPTSTAWAIVTNATWTVPATGPTGFRAIDTADAGTMIAPGALGALVTDTTAPDGTNLGIRLSAVPEPSTYAMILLGLVGVALLAKRQRGSTVV